MPCRPHQHGGGYAEIIVLSWRATANDPVLARFAPNRILIDAFTVRFL
jgi:hypothetical protein